MAANKSVIVLTPDGRRQNVQVTPNTTILQVNKLIFNIYSKLIFEFEFTLDSTCIVNRQIHIYL